ncbi:MAG: guanine deaminase [Paracoccaceae bacterium]
MITILRGETIRWAGDPFHDPEALVHDSDTAIVIDDGMIREVGPAEAILPRYPDAKLTRTPHLISPGFIDTHVHYPQIGIIASWGADLIDWLNGYTFPEEARFVDPDYAASAATAYFDEQLRHGVTTAASFCTIHPASVDTYFTEAKQRGVRAIGGKVMMDRNALENLRDTPQSGYDESKALINRWHAHDRITYAVTPRFAPTSTPEQLEAAGALSAEHPDCLMQTHLSEQHREIAWIAELFPDCADYLAVYERFGLVGARAVFGHAIHLTDRERVALKDHGASIAHCPTSNQFLGSGECAVLGLNESGIRTGLATDTGGGTSYSMFDTMKAAYEVARRRGDTLSPAQLWWLATQGSARALHHEHLIGNIAPGLEADLILIDRSATPLMAARTARAESISEMLFALIILGDDRAIAEVLSGGKPVWRREE